MARREKPIVDWARALLEERRENGGSSLALPEPPPRSSSTFDDDHKRYFLELLAATDSMKVSAMYAGFAPSTISSWAAEDPDFARALDLVRAAIRVFRRMRTRAELERRGIDGFNRKPVTVGKDGDVLRDPETGEVVYEVRYSDTALAKLVEIDYPELKRDAPTVEINTSGVIRVPETPKDVDAEFGGLVAPEIEVEFEIEGEGTE